MVLGMVAWDTCSLMVEGMVIYRGKEEILVVDIMVVRVGDGGGRGGGIGGGGGHGGDVEAGRMVLVQQE